jgi:hypothetical protein
MSKPKNYLSFFRSADLSKIAELTVINVKGAVEGCTRNCRTVGDCNLSCRVANVITIFMLFFTFTLSAQKVVKNADGNFEYVPCATAQEFADSKKYTYCCEYKHKDGKKYPVYLSKEGIYYWITKTKTGNWSARKLKAD